MAALHQLSSRLRYPLCLLVVTAASTLSCRPAADSNTDLRPPAAADGTAASDSLGRFGSDSLPKPTISLSQEALTPSPEEMQQEAEEVAARIARRFPDSAEALHVAAMLYFDLHQTQKAEPIWRKCVELAPNMAGVHVGLGTVAMSQGRDEEAVETLRRRWPSATSSPDVYQNLATSLGKLGRTAEAEAVLQTAVTTFPKHADHWLLLGQTQIRLDQFEAAERSLGRALELGLNSSKVYYSLANACARQGKTDLAAEYRARFVELKSDHAPPEGKWSEGRYPVILKQLTVAVLSNAGEVYMVQQDYDEAERLLSRAVALDPKHIKSHRLLAALYYLLGRPADAKLVQERLIELEPDNLLHHVNLASISGELGDYRSAEAALKRILDVSPNSAVAYTGLAELCLHVGKLDQARWYADECSAGTTRGRDMCFLPPSANGWATPRASTTR